MPNRTVDCPTELIALGKVRRRVIAASFGGGNLSPDAGVLLLRRTGERTGLTRALARVFAGGRRAASVTHPLHALLPSASTNGWSGPNWRWPMRMSLPVSSST